MQEALAQAQEKCAELQAKAAAAEKPALAHASVEGPDPRTAQQKATAIAYLNSQQVNKILQDMVAELIVSQPPSALKHMHATLANLLGNEPAGAGGTGTWTGDQDLAMKGRILKSPITGPYAGGMLGH